jgi:iron only hydrogenase large subunit-like protein
MRQCPTQAIRIRGNKAVFSEELCVDCGTCISVCPTSAIVPTTDPITEINQFKYKVVVPSSVLYSQFDPSIHPYIIHLAFKKLGFDRVVDATASSVVIAKTQEKFIKQYKGPYPLISSHCPSILRLIQVKYPGLVDQIIPLDVPREVTAREVRKNLSAELKLDPSEIGIIYIAPCTAKVVSIKQPAEKEKSCFDGALSIKEVYSILYPHIIAIKEQFDEKQIPPDFSFSTGWALLGSIIQIGKMENWLAVSGLDQVMQIINDIENSRLRNIDFVEAMVCRLGCFGGSLNVENPYVAWTNCIKQKEKYETGISVDEADIEKKYQEKYYFLEKPILPRPTQIFDTDLETSIKRMKEVERVYRNLRQIDCGCCGCPTCMAFAEDYVTGKVNLTDCVFLAEKEGSEENTGS